LKVVQIAVSRCSHTVKSDSSLNRYSIPWNAWYEHEQLNSYDRLTSGLEIMLPESWDCRMVDMTHAPALGVKAIAESIEKPIGSPPLAEILRRNPQHVAIVVDDLTRPTCLQPVIDFLLDKLEECGIKSRQVRIIFGVGVHKPLNKMEINKKLGLRAATSVDVISHDAHGELIEVPLGDGKSITINRRYVEADLKIVIGTVMPHLFAGYSGGAKLIVPGLAGFDAIVNTHKSVLMGMSGMLRQIEGNRFRERVEAMANIVGVDLSVQLVANHKREIVGIFAGDITSAHRAGAQFAENLYAADFPEDLDVVFLNAYPKDTELLQIENAFIAYRSAKKLLKKDGIVVVMAACSQGMGHHGLFEPGKPLYRAPRPFRFLEGRRVIVFAPGATDKEFYSLFWEGYSFHRQWRSVIDELLQRYPHTCNVGVIPCASFQMAKI
jgi:lactate racemase